MIKLYSDVDFAKCCELFIDVFNGAPWNDSWTDGAARAYLGELAGHARFLGYTLWDGCEGALIGAVFCHLKTHYRGDEIFVDEMYIASDYQRKGYGMALMREVERYAKENNIISITLLTGKNMPAFGFYQKFGCRHLEHLAFMHKRIERIV